MTLRGMECHKYPPCEAWTPIRPINAPPHARRCAIDCALIRAAMCAGMSGGGVVSLYSRCKAPRPSAHVQHDTGWTPRRQQAAPEGGLRRLLRLCWFDFDWRSAFWRQRQKVPSLNASFTIWNEKGTGSPGAGIEDLNCRLYGSRDSVFEIRFIGPLLDCGEC